MNIEPTHQPAILLGPPESRNKQRKCGIVNYIPPVGASKGICTFCEDKVWLGPKQMELKDRHPDAVAVCFPCAVSHGLYAPGNVAVSLGGQGGGYDMASGHSFHPDMRGTN